MIRTMGVLLMLLFCVQFAMGQNEMNIYFNEIEPNDESTDVQEFIELVGPAGTNLQGLVIVHYNGSKSSNTPLWEFEIGEITLPFDGTTAVDGTPLGYYVLAQASGDTSLVANWDEILPSSYGLQNGADGLILFKNDTLVQENVLDAVAWGGTGDLNVDDPGFVSTEVAGSENTFLCGLPDDDGANTTLQLGDNVLSSDSSAWEQLPPTPGAVNHNQTGSNVALPVELVLFQAHPTTDGIQLVWQTASEERTLGFILQRRDDEQNEFTTIASYATHPQLRSRGTSNKATDYYFNDTSILAAKTVYYRLVDVDADGGQTMHDPIRVAALPQNHQLMRAYPNPFNPQINIQINIQAAGNATVIVYDLLGRPVRSLLDRQVLPGDLRLAWDGRDDAGATLSAGVYWVRFQQDQLSRVSKIVFSK